MWSIEVEKLNICVISGCELSLGWWEWAKSYKGGSCGRERVSLEDARRSEDAPASQVRKMVEMGDAVYVAMRVQSVALGNSGSVAALRINPHVAGKMMICPSPSEISIISSTRERKYALR